MSEDNELFSRTIRVGPKDLFVDVKRNDNGVYVKISERKGQKRNTVLFPASCLGDLVSALTEAETVASSAGVQATSAPAAAPSNPNVVFANGFPKGTRSEDIQMFVARAGVKASGLTILASSPRAKVEAILIEFTNAADAANAVEQLTGKTFGDKEIRARLDRGARSTGAPATAPAATAEGKRAPRKSEKLADPDAPKQVDSKRVFVSNLTWDTTEEELSRFFSVVGRVTSAEVKTARRTGRSLGNAVVEFEDATSVYTAIAQLNNQDLKGRTVLVREFFV